tara:strand:+ start:157 stop:984 length:828 start_codon:yes stop_codon:yes gene_type:complete
MGSNLVLLSSGCSYTDPKLTPNNWSRQLADDLEMLPLCKGRSGGGNQYIFESLVDSISSLKSETIGLVVAQWSGIDRYDLELVDDEYLHFHGYKYTGNAHKGRKGVLGADPHREAIYDMISRQFVNQNFEDVLDMYTRKKFRYAYALQQLCNSLNIKLVQFQGTEPWWIDDGFYFYDYEVGLNHQKVLDNYERMILKSKYAKKVNTFLNNDLNFCWNTELMRREGDGRENPIYRVGYKAKDNWYVGYTGKLTFDWHPNELGHTVIKDIIKEHINS